MVDIHKEIIGLGSAVDLKAVQRRIIQEERARKGIPVQTVHDLHRYGKGVIAFLADFPRSIGSQLHF